MRLHFKFKDGTKPSAREGLVETLRERGAGVRPLFPGDEDEEFAAIFAVECESPREAAALLRLLRRAPVVDYVEEEAKRRLVR